MKNVFAMRRFMRTIERLCKYKDVTDLLYKNVHQLLTKELINEFVALQGEIYYEEDDILRENPESLTFNTGYLSCFGWRQLGNGRPDWPIYHVSHKEHTCFETGQMTVRGY